jgi:hypothetical protein
MCGLPRTLWHAVSSAGTLLHHGQDVRIYIAGIKNFPINTDCSHVLRLKRRRCEGVHILLRTQGPREAARHNPKRADGNALAERHNQT